MGKAARLRREGRAWAGALGDEKKSLLSFAGVMDTEFVALSNGLMHLSAQLNQIQKQCQSLTDLTLGGTEDAAVQFAFQLLKKAEDLVLASYDQYDQVFSVFRELQGWLSQLPRQHGELLRVLLPLNIITTTFRIEASRHPAEVQEVFTGLAARVNRMVNEVRGALERQFAELAASEQVVQRLMEQVSVSIQCHRKQAADGLETSRHHLRALSQTLASSGAGVANLTRQNQAVTRHIGDIVVALQCQDIAGQKITHVAEAMEEMRAHLEEETPTVASASRQFVFQAARIQSHQVQGVFDQLNDVAETLESNIQGVRSETAAAAAVAVKVGGATLNANVASQSQARIGEMLAIIQQAIGQIGDILAAFESLQARFVNCSKEAAELTVDVRYAALNAQVFAIRATNGGSLEVVAGRMRIVSDETIAQVKRMDASLSQTDEMINNLRQRLADFQGLGHAELQVLTDESALSRQKLADLEDAIPALVKHITEEQETFARSVDGVVARVLFPGAAAAAQERARAFFQDLLAWSDQGNAENALASSASQKIDLLKANYTMASERHAHAAALRPASQPASSAVSQPSVEMFDPFKLEPTASAASREEMHLPSGDLEPQPSPIDLPSGAPAQPEPVLPLAAEKPTGSEDLGANVEMF